MSRRSTALAIFLALLASYAYFLPHWADWNQNSRLDLVLAIVDQGELSIDAYVENTGDYARHEGRTYSDKAPGLSFLGVPVYWAYRTVAQIAPAQAMIDRIAHSESLADTLNPEGTGIQADKVYQALALTVLTVVTVAVPAALSGAAMYWLLGFFTSRALVRIGLVLAYGLGTLIFPYAWAYYGHVLSGVLVFGAFVWLFRIRQTGRWYLWEAGGVGLLLGYAVITEYPAALIAGLVLFYAVYVLRNVRGVFLAIMGMIPPAMLLAAYNMAIYGTPVPVGYQYSELWQDQHSTGFLSLTVPHPATALELTFGLYRGLFVLSPYLLLGVVGFALMWRHNRAYRAELSVSMGAALAMLLFNASSSMWWGGFAFGPRYLVPMLPFLAWLVVGFLEVLHGRAWSAPLAWGLVALSLLLIGANTISGQSFPEETVRIPTMRALEQLAAGDIARNLGMVLGLRGWASLVPLGVCFATIAAAAWAAHKITSRETAFTDARVDAATATSAVKDL